MLRPAKICSITDTKAFSCSIDLSAHVADGPRHTYINAFMHGYVATPTDSPTYIPACLLTYLSHTNIHAYTHERSFAYVYIYIERDIWYRHGLT